MTTERTSIFDSGLDVSDFAPKAKPEVMRPQPEEIDKTAGRRFKSREATPKADQSETEDQRFTIRKPMTYRTGRNVVLSVKTTQATVDAFYKLALENGWKAGETFEKVVSLMASSQT